VVEFGLVQVAHVDMALSHYAGKIGKNVSCLVRGEGVINRRTILAYIIEYLARLLSLIYCEKILFNFYV